ncbi:acyltransferase 3 [Caballeronia glebae]|uniref:Acyltransferase 3 n=1 Tax=Caballeronia glebae TaxID=1777143 RepID=A0A158D5L3_9BURK|nr:acyltransferase [Caballeronia glebae]SAK89630.1 acyltransferase 3 [Caballeronia glebae]
MAPNGGGKEKESGMILNPRDDPREDSDPKMQSRKLDFIQTLRGIAALAVTFVHIRQHTEHPIPFVSWLIRPAASGVDLFFIISGFIMVYTTSRNDGSLAYCADFMKKRFTRVWPTYIVLTVFYVIAMLISGSIIHRQDISPTLANWIKSIFFVPLELDGNGPFWGAALLHTGWTLNYEIYFYIAFAVCLMFGRASIIAFSAWLAITLIAIPYTYFGIFSFDASPPYKWMDFQYLNLATSPIIWEFLVGALSGYLYFSPIRIKSETTCWILLSLAISLMIWVLWGLPTRGFGLAGFGVGYAIFFPVIVLVSKTLPLKQPRVFVWLGNISFSLYLVHPIIVHPAANLLYMWEWARPGLGDFPFGLVLTVVSIAVSAVSYELLEKRLSSWILEKLKRKRVTSSPTRSSA